MRDVTAAKTSAPGVVHHVGLACSRVAPFWASGASPAARVSRGPFLDYRPPPQSKRVHSDLGWIPSSELTTYGPPDYVSRVDFPGFFRHLSTVSLALAPCSGESPFSPRFRSQVFSTSQRFRSRLELHGFVSPRNRS